MEESLEDIEARLYAQVYHDNTGIEPAPETVEFLPPNYNKQSNKRYWIQSKNMSTQKDSADFNYFNYHSSNDKPAARPRAPTVHKRSQQTILAEKKEPAEITPMKAFVPYSSVLTFMASPLPPVEPAEGQTTYEKKKTKPAKFPKNKLINPASLNKQGVSKSKTELKAVIMAKKQKAAFARKKSQAKVLTTIELEDSDESDCIPVELPPPPLISLDSSDDDSVMKKKRSMSPSTSSMMSDDFIFAGDKRRLESIFLPEESFRSIPQSQETLLKVKALTKVSSSSSSDSTRSSCERTANQMPIDGEPKKKRKSNERNSLDKSKEDSVYSAKIKSKRQSQDAQEKDSSEEETPCVDVRIQNVRRRKSTGSRNKSSEDQSDTEDSKTKLVSNKTLNQAKKRSRFLTPSYNDDEFASMISTILRGGESEENITTRDSSNEMEAVNTSESLNTTIEENPKIEVENNQEDDCKIIDQPPVVIEVNSQDEDDPVESDSDSSMRGIKLPDDCDLSLNVTHVPYDPHVYIKNAGSSKALQQEVAAPVTALSAHPEIGWNYEMKFFYDESWGDESFTVTQMLKSMPGDPKLWRINNQDRNRTYDSGCRLRCKKCNEIGHIAVRCTKPRKRVVCFMCGEEGHRETRCPNSICLRCGKPNKIFATVCSSCHKLTKRHCPLCSYQGHDIEQCPDKWRRYHSTTSENSELGSDYEVNPRVYCSICARRGHFAENCNQFFKTISGMITSSCLNIKSHKRSYPRVYSFDEKEEVKSNEPVYLALFSYFPFYRFNFKFPRNARLYPKFLEQFRLHQKQQAALLPAIEPPPTESSKKKKRKRKSREAETSELQISITSEGNRSVASKGTPPMAHDDSNSNYSFSDFFKQPHSSTDEMFKSPDNIADTSTKDDLSPGSTPTATVVSGVNIDVTPQAKTTPTLVVNPFATKLPEFIPLDSPIDNCLQIAENRQLVTENNQRLHTLESTSRKIEILRTPETSESARVYLSKDHHHFLSNRNGIKFLQVLQERLNVTANFKWDNTGNSLFITGMPSDQSLFHLEIREFLYKHEVDRHEALLRTSSQVPKTKERIINFLKANLQSITKQKVFGVKKTLEAMTLAEKSMDYKKVLKCRKSLNIAFIGDAELDEGDHHVGMLRRILFVLEKDVAQGNLEINAEQREEIMSHMNPIFSTMNHGNYEKLFQQYLKVINKRKKKHLVPNPILN